MLPLHTVTGNKRFLSHRHSRHLHNYPPIWVYGTLPIQYTKVNLKNLHLCLSTTLWRRIWNEARCVPHVCTRHKVIIQNPVSWPLVICGPISIRTCQGREKFLLLCGIKLRSLFLQPVTLPTSLTLLRYANHTTGSYCTSEALYTCVYALVATRIHISWSLRKKERGVKRSSSPQFLLYLPATEEQSPTTLTFNNPLNMWQWLNHCVQYAVGHQLSSVEGTSHKHDVSDDGSTPIFVAAAVVCCLAQQPIII